MPAPRMNPCDSWTEGPFGVYLPSELCKALDEMVKDTQAKELGGVAKAFVAKAATEFLPGERADISTITDSSVDHDGEVVIATGLDLSLFRKNPVTLYQHRRDMMPVGKAQWIAVRGDSVKAKTIYASRPAGWEGDWLADAVWSLVHEGILAGKSIGFIPTEAREATKAEQDAHGVARVFSKAILVEYSVVSIPANKQALVEAVNKGLVTKTMAGELGFEIPAELAKLPPVVERKSCSVLEAAEVERQVERMIGEVVDPKMIEKMVQDTIDVHFGRV